LGHPRLRMTSIPANRRSSSCTLNKKGVLSLSLLQRVNCRSVFAAAIKFCREKKKIKLKKKKRNTFGWESRKTFLSSLAFIRVTLN
jgi:hypothetical protein